MNGTIKRLVSDKGFGFIATSDGNDTFSTSRACTQIPFDDLREGQAVTFDGAKVPKDRAERTSSRSDFESSLVGSPHARPSRLTTS